MTVHVENTPIVELVSIAELKTDANSSRRHSKSQINKLARSIEAFGIPVPILVDEENAILDGRAVVEAARSLARTHVPVLRVENLSTTKKRALRLALNRLAEDAVWDRERLAIELEELAGLEIDLALTGFEIPEIDLIVEEHRIQSTDQPDAEDAFPDAPSAIVSRTGDVWILGKHRLLCGDAREEANYRDLLDGERARMVFADPPYNVRVADIGNRGRVKHPEFAMASGEMTREE